MPYNAQAAINQVNSNIGRPRTPVTNPVTSDSSQYRGYTSSLGDSLNSLLAQMSADYANGGNSADELTSYSKRAQDSITEYRRQLADRNAAENTRINDLFNTTRANTEKAQARDFAGRSTSLITSGGYLGGTQSHEGALQNLKDTQGQEIQALEQKRASALAQAKDSYDEQDWKATQASLDEERQLRKDINDAKNSNASRVLQLISATREEKTFEQNQADDTVKRLSFMSPEDLTGVDPATFDNLDKVYQMPSGFSQRYVQTQQAIQGAKTHNEVVTQQKNLINLMQDIGPGKSFTFADGSVVRGIDSPGNWSVHTITGTDTAGNKIMSILKVNKLTGEQNLSRVPGTFGSSSGESGGLSSPEIIGAFQKLAGSTVTDPASKSLKFSYSEFVKVYTSLSSASKKVMYNNVYMDDFLPKDQAKLKKAGFVFKTNRPGQDMNFSNTDYWTNQNEE